MVLVTYTGRAREGLMTCEPTVLESWITVSMMRWQNRAGTGSASVQIHKTSMELVMYTGRAREGHMGCEVREWELKISVKHLVTHGARGTRQMETIAEEWRGSVTPVW